MQVASRRPIRTYEDLDCLNYISMSDSDESICSDSGMNWRETQPVSRTFYNDKQHAHQHTGRKGTYVDERLIDLLQRLPKDKLISLK